MYEIITEIEINANAECVWSILMDFPAYPNWNPFVRAIAGAPTQGSRLEVCVQPQDKKTMVFRPVILTITPKLEFRWLGRLLFPGIFDGEHYFVITALAPNQVRFTQGEKLSGILVPLFRTTLECNTRAGFEAMNKALKLRAESAPTSLPSASILINAASSRP